MPTIKPHGNIGNCNNSLTYTSEVLEYLDEVTLIKKLILTKEDKTMI